MSGPLRKFAQTLHKSVSETFIGSLSLPLLHLLANDRWIGRTRRVYFNVAALHAYRSTGGPHDFQPITSPEIEVGLASNKFPPWCARKILLEISYLTPYPPRPLAHPF